MFENTYALSPYRIMWVFVLFDLPTLEKRDRKAYAKFVKDLKKEGFQLYQYSIYIKHCSSIENADALCRKVRWLLPQKGKVSVMQLTDKQFSRIINYWCASRVNGPIAPEQLSLF